jgi:membrane protease YdiL (CAAX protease family)
MKRSVDNWGIIPVKPTHSQGVLVLLLPLLLIPSTAFVFVSTSRWSNAELGYVFGFLFYWLIWCLLVPLYVLKRGGVRSLFREENPLFRRSNWLPAVLLVVIVAITVVMYPPRGLLAAPVRLLIIAVPVAIVNGVCEELLWRGLYVRVFPRNMVLGLVYPSIGFALWHISPQLVVPAESGVWPFVASTFFLGISYGWISYRTGSIRWNAIAHSIGGILAVGGAIAPSIHALLFQ